MVRSHAQSRRVLSTVCLSLAFLVSACGGGGTSSGNSADKYKFAVVEAVVNPFYTPFPQALDDVSKAEKIPVPLLGAPQNFDQTQENTIIDGFVAKGIKALAVQPVDAVAGNQTIKRLVQQHINVVTFGSCGKTQEAGAIYCLQSDVKKASYIATKNLIQTIGGKGKIVHLAGQVADTSTAPRIAGVEQAVSEAGGSVTLLQTISDIDSAEAAQNAPAPGEAAPFCLREIGSTIYSYRPTGESAEGLCPGIFAALPITGFALIQLSDGAVNERAKAKIEEAQEKNGAMALPFYETDQ